MMVLSQLQRVLPRRVLAVVLLLSSPAILSGCANVGDHLPTAAGGLPEGAPARQATPTAYPAVNDLPPPRESQVLTYEEQKKLEEDLIAARTRAAATAKSAATSNAPSQ